MDFIITHKCGHVVEHEIFIKTTKRRVAERATLRNQNCQKCQETMTDSIENMIYVNYMIGDIEDACDKHGIKRYSGKRKLDRHTLEKNLIEHLKKYGTPSDFGCVNYD
ncbi:hypothetical protein [Methanolapillus millepedarum]|uniref:Uncharacterized protein n=1 Tax=Methanolapillus millepedarum TaxID=3028296 RepID=A0AA96V4Q4_9EURY|nr:hypothetical protein MsAc7_17460 [Methanosarcinaceae archaeon Ac7]